jgi:hypothetical protein
VKPVSCDNEASETFLKTCNVAIRDHRTHSNAVMPPQIPSGVTSQLRLPRTVRRRPYSSPCLLCQFSVSASRPSLSRKRVQSRTETPSKSRRQYSNNSSIEFAADSRVPVAELKEALLDLQKHSRTFVNISRIQLALRGLEQQPRQETIRIAISGLAGQGETTRKVRELVRLLVADPLKDEEEWERVLLAPENGDRPLLLKIGAEAQDENGQFGSSRLIQELHISSPLLNSHRLEILVLQSDILPDEQGGFADTILVPTVEIPMSNTGRYTPITTPVHRALILGDGIMGAASLATLPVDVDSNTITAAVDLPGQVESTQEALPFQIVDIALAEGALKSFRESVENAMSYEHDWFSSGLPSLVDWLKSGTACAAEGVAIKAPVVSSIRSLLADSNGRIEAEQARRLAIKLSSNVPTPALHSLRSGLQEWAHRAHTELRDQLDMAFEGRRWRKLGWWKLFWRVDDVSMLTTDILSQRFLRDAETEIVYLAGRIEEAGVFRNRPVVQQQNWAYKPLPPPEAQTLGSAPPPPTFKDLLDKPQDDSAPDSIKPRPWPLQIPATRTYLILETVPALQALAQKLVLQTITTSSFASIFSGLIYVSTLSTSLYEAGAVAALGIVWSLKRMQNKWETARAFWEGEVREEGRRSIRAVEGVVGGVLQEPAERDIDGRAELDAARRTVDRAEKALERITKS